MIRFLVVFAVFTQISFSQQVWKNQDTTSTILITFSEPIQQNLSIYDFSLIDSATRQNYRLYGFGYPQSQNNSVVLISERIRYKSTAVLSVTNVTDTAGNVISTENNKFYIYHNGLNINLQKPIVR